VRRALLLALAFLAAPALAQPAKDSPADKDARARVRVEGAAGGTGNPVAKGEGKRDAI